MCFAESGTDPACVAGPFKGVNRILQFLYREEAWLSVSARNCEKQMRNTNETQAPLPILTAYSNLCQSVSGSANSQTVRYDERVKAMMQ